MIILSIKTDQPQAELGLFNVQGRTSHMQLAYVKWQAHRKLADTIHLKLQKLLSLQGRALQDVKGIVCFKGPGSFTGLRIGLSVANALADVQGIPVVARQGQNWLKPGIKDLLSGRNDRIATPYYDRPAATSRPKS